MAALTTLSNLKIFVMNQVPGCDEGPVMDALIGAIEKFCERTGIWTEELSITTTADTAEVTLTPTDDQSVVHRIDWLKYDADDGEGVAAYIPDNQYKLDLTTSELVFAATNIPNDEYDMTVKVILIPLWRATSYPAWLLNRYKRGLIAGAAMDLLLLPRRPWSDPKQAAVKASEWRDAISDAKGEEQREGTNRVPGFTP